MTPIIVAVAAFVGVAALVGGVAFMFRSVAESKMEDRLTLLAASGGKQGKSILENSLLLNSPLDHSNGFLEDFVERFGSLSRLFEQADTNLTPARFLAISVVLGVGAAVAFGFAGIHPGLIPVMAIGSALLPLMWLIMRRRRRLSKFAAQLPDALELIARALRAGHSLAAGFDLVAKEMCEPIGREFGRIFEEQNLGVAMEDALMNITHRVPNLDLKFFVTAIILQRQTGGDLAEILDKIGHLIRERFQIYGAVQALTGEGRLSGIVLLALPPVLFVAVYRMNPDYMMILFSDDMGKQMLIGAVISQLIGALVIRKIVNIKVERAMDILIAEAFDFARLVPLAVFGAFAVVAWWLMNQFAADKPRAEQRLDEFREAPARRAEAARGTSVRKNEGMAKFFEKASPALAKPLQSSNVKETNRLKERLAHAGFRGDGAPSIYLGFKVILLGAGFFLGGGGMILAKGFTQESIMYTIAIAGIAFYVPEAAVWLLARSRKEAIFLSLPDALDLMVVCVEAGLGLDQAMRKVADEMKATYRVIAGEFAMCNFQLQMGRPRTDVLHELGYRTGVDDLRALAAILIQADKFGSSIAQALRVQSDSMRIRRRQLAEERAAKTAVKLIFPLVLFIFPAIFVVLVGPAAITMINEMFPAMNGGM